MVFYMDYQSACWINCNEYRTIAPDWFLENRNFVMKRLLFMNYTGYRLNIESSLKYF